MEFLHFAAGFTFFNVWTKFTCSCSGECGSFPHIFSSFSAASQTFAARNLHFGPLFCRFSFEFAFFSSSEIFLLFALAWRQRRSLVNKN